MLARARHIVRDERGSALVDFGLLLPVLVALLVGTIELTNLLRLERKVVAAAQTTADLVTQRRDVSNAQLDDFLRASELILEPYPSSAIAVGIAGVRYNPATGNPEVMWTKSRNGGSVPDAETLAQGLGAKGEGVVVVRVAYSYVPLFFDFLLDPTTIEEVAILRPRRSNVVEGPGS